jgi:hypothetical protein
MVQHGSEKVYSTKVCSTKVCSTKDVHIVLLATSLSNCLDNGFTKDLNRDTTTPFGRALYQRKAPFFVYTYALILVINFFIIVLSAKYWSISAVAAAQVLSRIDLHSNHRVTEIWHPSWFRPTTTYGLIRLSCVVRNSLRCEPGVISLFIKFKAFSNSANPV